MKEQQPGVDDSKFKKNRQWFITLITTAIIVAVVVFITFFFIIGTSRVDGKSMLPTLKNEQTVFFLRMTKTYNKGEIIAIRLPNGDEYVKRVIAVPGDEIDIHDGKVYVNGTAIDEPYIQGKTQKTSDRVEFPLVIRPEKLFVLGDNRENSVDSRYLGEVSYYSVLGKIFN